MKRWLALSVCGLLLGVPPAAAQSPCAAIPAHAAPREADALRALASRCDDPLATRLRYNRADHAELIEAAVRYRAFLDSPQGRRVGHRDGVGRLRQFTAYRTYMEMLEAFAPLFEPDGRRRMALLNREYEHHGSLAELRLRGLDQVADLEAREVERSRLDDAVRP